jgi:type I restriction enzyme S subunit
MNDFYTAFKSIHQPKEWSISKLVDVCDLITCGVAARPNYVESEGVPFLSSLNVKQGKIVWKGYQQISIDDHNELTKNNKPIKGDILYTRVGSFGEAAIVEIDVEFSVFVSLTLIKPKSAVTNNFYLKHLLNSSEVKALANNTTTGLGVQNLNVSEVRRFELPFPPLPEQQKIAAILTSVDKVIEKTQAKIDKLKDLKTAMMQELLTRGVGVDGKPHTEFKDSPVGRIPKGWDVVKMDSICNKITDGEHQTPKRTSEGYFLLSARNIRDGYIALHDVDFVPEAEYQRISKRVLPQQGDILISCSGSIGRTAVVPENMKFSMVRSVAILQPKRNLVDSQFLAYQVSSTQIQTQIEKSLSQLAQANLFQAPIKALNVVIPPFSEQQKIANIIKSVDTNILNKSKNLDSIKNTKKALMQDLLTGKVRVQVGAS